VYLYSAKLAYVTNYLRVYYAVFTKFSGLVDVWLRIITLTFILRLLKEHCCDNQLIFGVHSNN